MSARAHVLRTAALALLGTLASAALSSCFSDRQSSTSPQAKGTCTIAATSAVFGVDQVVIPIRDFAFRPDTVHVKRGTRVAWVNCDEAVHTSTSDTGAWSSPTFGLGETYSRVFDQPGRFRYHCLPHPFMTGTIIVD